MRIPVGAGLLAGLTVLALAACGGPPPQPTDYSTDVDRQRAHTLAEEAILTHAVGPPELSLGMVHNDKVGWDRTEIDASLLESSGGTTPDASAVEREFAKDIGILRDSGWTVHFQMCLPPPLTDLLGQQLNPVQIPFAYPRLNGYQWLAAAHKLIGGVSYAALLSAVRGGNGAFIEVVLRAPNSRDHDNLFPDEPAGVKADQGCAEDGQISDDAQKVGTPAMIRDWWPYPSQTRDRDPEQV